MAKSHSEIENEKVMEKVDEINKKTIVDVAAGEDPVGDKAMNPAAISGNVWARGKGKKEKTKSK